MLIELCFNGGNCAKENVVMFCLYIYFVDFVHVSGRALPGRLDEGPIHCEIDKVYVAAGRKLKPLEMTHIYPGMLN